MYNAAYNWNSLGRWVGRSVMADATKTTACLTGHMTHTQAPVVCEKSIFHFFCFTQPVENYPYYPIKKQHEHSRVLWKLSHQHSNFGMKIVGSVLSRRWDFSIKLLVLIQDNLDSDILFYFLKYKKMTSLPMTARWDKFLDGFYWLVGTVFLQTQNFKWILVTESSSIFSWKVSTREILHCCHTWTNATVTTIIMAWNINQ